MNLLHINDPGTGYPASWYAATRSELAPFPPLQGEVRADVCVVGGGYTGLSAALHLRQKGFDVVLLEAKRLGFGASGRNGGQVGSGQRQDQVWLEKTMGKEAAHGLWALAEEAKATVKHLIDSHAIACDWRPGVAQACWSAAEVRDAHAYAEKLRRDYGYAALEPLDRDGMAALVRSGVYAGGEVDRGAAVLHPLNYALGLGRAAASAGVRVHETSEVTAIRPGAKPVVETANGRVVADHVVLAANGYLGGLDPHVAARVMPINNFVIATEPLGDRALREVLGEPVAVADTKFVVNYWHLSPDNRLIFGGGESYGYRFPDVVRTVRKPMLQVYPGLADVKITHGWGGTLAITMNRMPCFARPAPGLYSASGYSGHGVAMATLAGKLLSEAVAGDAGRFDLMGSVPQPRFPGGAALRWPLLVAAMTWYSMRDRLGL